MSHIRAVEIDLPQFSEPFRAKVKRHRPSMDNVVVCKRAEFRITRSDISTRKSLDDRYIDAIELLQRRKFDDVLRLVTAYVGSEDRFAVLAVACFKFACVEKKEDVGVLRTLRTNGLANTWQQAHQLRRSLGFQDTDVSSVPFASHQVAMYLDKPFSEEGRKARESAIRRVGARWTLALVP